MRPLLLDRRAVRVPASMQDVLDLGEILRELARAIERQGEK
ncbi:hypothetical protein [Mycobacterium sp. 48b]